LEAAMPDKAYDPLEKTSMNELLSTVRVLI